MNNLIDMDLNCLLNSWSLSHLYNRLHEEGITTEVLKMLRNYHIDRLLANFSIGDQIKFEYNLDKWKNENKHIGNTADPQQNNSFIQTSKTSVMEILSSTYNGREILSFHKQNKILYEEQRNLLINTITKYIEANGIECSLSDCAEIEKQICSIFSSEQLEFYTNGKRGKIYNKLAHLKRLSKDILKKDEKTPTTSNLEESEENYALILENLKSKSITAEEFDLYWRKCAPLRFKQISESKSTAEIFNLWPDYIKPSGFQLIHLDFVMKFPTAKNLCDKWSQYENNILSFLKSKISNAQITKQLHDIESKDTESKIFTIFWYLHVLFPPQQKVATEPSGSKIRKKHTIADSQESFAIIATTKNELEAKLKLLKLQCCNIQPKLLIIGEFFNVKSIYVYIDDIKYPFLTFLNAFDTLFKIFFLFNLKYPEESDVFYNFIQSFFYDLNTLKKYARVSAIKHDIINKN